MRYVLLSICMGLSLCLLGQGIADSELDNRLAASAAIIVGDDATAISHYAQANSLTNPEKIQYGKALYRMGDYDKAIAIFETIGKEGEAGLYWMKSLAKKQNVNAACDVLRGYLSSRNKLSEAELRMDEDLSLFERSRIWLQIWDEQKWYSAQELRYYEIKRDLTREKWVEVFASVGELIDEGKGNARLYQLRADAYLANNNPNRALLDYQKALEGNSKDLGLLQSTIIAALEASNGSYALEIIERALRIAPYDLELYRLRADAYRLLGRTSEAENDSKLYLHYLSGNATALYALAQQMLNQQDYAHALNYLDQLIAADAANPHYFLSRAEVKWKQSDFIGADYDAAQVLDIDPTNAQGLLLRAKLLIEQGEEKQACVYLKRALRYGESEAASLIYKYCR